jgi:hypothetical protein
MRVVLIRDFDSPGADIVRRLYAAGAPGGHGFAYTAWIPGTYWPGSFYQLLHQTAAETDHTLLAPQDHDECALCR